MDENDIGKVFLFALEWDWTVVGRLVGFVGERLILSEAGYFTRTGATFNQLCKRGFVMEGERRTLFHPSLAVNGRMRVPNRGLVWEWEAAWPQPSTEG